MNVKHAPVLALLALIAVGCGSSSEPTKVEEQTFRNPQRTMPAGAAPGAPPSGPVNSGK